MAAKKMTMGVIVGNRGFFPDHLAKSGREEIIRALESAGMEAVVLSPEQRKYGAGEAGQDTRRCADLFKQNRHRIDGIIVRVPNFGEEPAHAENLPLDDLARPD